MWNDRRRQSVIERDRLNPSIRQKQTGEQADRLTDKRMIERKRIGDRRQKKKNR